MPLGDRLNERLLARLDGSGLTITVHYPAVRPIATGSSPAVTVINPLTGPAPTTAVVDVPSTPIKAPVTLKCLWTDSMMSVRTSLNDGEIAVEQTGWLAGADAAVRVRVSEAAINTNDPYGDTVFTGCDHIEFNGHHYEVLAVKPVGPSFRVPITYYVWVKGANKQ